MSLFLLGGSLRVSAVGLWLLSELVFVFEVLWGTLRLPRIYRFTLCVHHSELSGFAGCAILLSNGAPFPSPKVHFVCRCAALRFFCVRAVLYSTLAYFCSG